MSRQEIVEIAKKYAEDIRPYEVKTYIELSDKQINNARETVGKRCAKKDMLALVDLTLFKSGKQGILFTEKALYSKELDGKKINGKVVYNDIQSVEKVSKSDLCFKFKDGKEETIFVYSGYLTYIYNTLKDILDMVEKEQSESADPKLTKQKDKKTTTKSNVKHNQRIVYDDGAIYVGDVLDNKRSGKGKMTWKDGESYDGDWINDKKSGSGKYIYNNGDIYEGNFVNDQKSGQGKYSWLSGSVYEGDWVKGIRTGKGKYIWADGEVYEGDFLNNKMTGYGKKQWADGDVYEGNFVDGELEGKGKYIYKNDYTLEGNFVNGEPQGLVKITLSDGTVFEGNFKDGDLKGNTKCTLPDGYVFEGTYVEFNLEGQGKCITPEGNIYEGNFVHFNFEGQGKYTWHDGDVYEGNWLDNQKNGKGKYTWPNGDVYEGDWVNDARTGKGKYTWANGDVYEGDFVNGIIEGYGKKTYKDGTVEEGKWHDDQFVDPLVTSNLKQKLTDQKPHLNILTLGWSQNGKTTLTAAMSKVLSIRFPENQSVDFDTIDHALEINEAGMVFHSSYVEYSIDEHHYLLVDAPEDDQAKVMKAFCDQWDIAIIVVSSVAQISAQLKESLSLAHQSGIKKIIVYLNKFDLMSDPSIDSIEKIVQGTVSDYGFDQDCIILHGSAFNALKKPRSKWGDPVLKLILTIDEYFPDEK